MSGYVEEQALVGKAVRWKEVICCVGLSRNIR